MRTPSAPFEPLHLRGESITLDTSGKVLVLPSGNSAVLPSFNEYTLNSNRLSIAESPFGGLKGSGSPDYCPGTLYTPTVGVYLTDVAGNNSTKTLTAGMLKGVNGLTVDTEGHTITEEFIVSNTWESNNPTVIDDCSSATGWIFSLGTGSISVENGKIKIVGTTDANGYLLISKTITLTNISLQSFVSAKYISSLQGNSYLGIGNNVTNRVRAANKASMAVSAGVESVVIMAFKAPASETGHNPNGIAGTLNWNTVQWISCGAAGMTPGAACTFYISSLQVDTAKSAYTELQTPDNLAASSLATQCWTGSSYETVRTDALDGAYSNVSIDTTKAKFLDSTLLDHVFGTGLGRAVFPKGVSGAEVTGSTGTMTYSANQGTSQRIGLMVSLPPSDGGRTDFNKIRLRTILTYAPDVDDNYSASYDFADSTTASYGLQNLSKPWIALYDPTTSEVDFYLFTHRPKNLTYKRDESGTIYELSLYPGNGQIYHGQIDYADLTADTDSNDIPNCLEASLEGSLTKFLQGYGMVI